MHYYFLYNKIGKTFRIIRSLQKQLHLNRPKKTSGTFNLQHISPAILHKATFLNFMQDMTLTLVQEVKILEIFEHL